MLMTGFCPERPFVARAHLPTGTEKGYGVLLLENHPCVRHVDRRLRVLVARCLLEDPYARPTADTLFWAIQDRLDEGFAQKEEKAFKTFSRDFLEPRPGKKSRAMPSPQSGDAATADRSLRRLHGVLGSRIVKPLSYLATQLRRLMARGYSSSSPEPGGLAGRKPAQRQRQGNRTEEDKKLLANASREQHAKKMEARRAQLAKKAALKNHPIHRPHPAKRPGPGPQQAQHQQRPQRPQRPLKRKNQPPPANQPPKKIMKRQ
jgi:hypothetical protein